MRVQQNALFHCDCLALLERLDSKQVALAYVDPPWYPDRSGRYADEDMRAHLVFLGQVLQQIRRVLTPRGSLYFHSNPFFPANTRLILDQVFGRQSFVAEIVWPRTDRRALLRKPQAGHDTIYVYSKGDAPLHSPLLAGNASSRPSQYTRADEQGQFQLVSLVRPGELPSHRYEWLGVLPPPNHSWRYSREVLEGLLQEGLIRQSREGAVPRLKRYLPETRSRGFGTVWNDIPSALQREEDSQYPSQKPLSLLNRIIEVATLGGDLVLDPFCGSGTALVAAQQSGRLWVGCDSSAQACATTMKRLQRCCASESSAGLDTCEQRSLQSIPLAEGCSYRPLMLAPLDPVAPYPKPFILNRPIDLEEDRHHEFKEVRGANPVGIIKDTADEYVVSFLNSEGGTIYWGIRDSDGMVVGVRLVRTQRDDLQRVVSEKLGQITPTIDPTAYRVIFHEAYDGSRPVSDVYVVTVTAPWVQAATPFFTGRGEAFIRVDGATYKLRGQALIDWVERRRQD